MRDKITFPLILLILTPLWAWSQFSVETKIQLPANAPSNPTEINSHLDLSIHYWTRLKKIRVEFLPGVSYQKPLSSETNTQGMGITLPTLFYILDMINDCDCPTFSKNDYLIEKGLFIRLAPGYQYFWHDSENLAAVHTLPIELSLGLDLGISDLLTITPLIGYKQHIYTNETYQHQGYIHAGVSLLFRPDYRRRYR